MPGRTLGLTLVVALAAGCAATTPAARFQPSRPADPDRFERAACLRGDLPIEVDTAAYARARTADRQAERSGQASPGATGQLLTQRAAFESRCAAWREAALTSAELGPRPSGPVVAASYQLQR